ncbi:ribonuclease domain-containing protein [Lysobacter sp. cf310]|uniref:ribonuclease domain-containing protein n=1 Tax=Lysobacter sp. cf310 TaxID=1761790 RepID=UPI0008E40219|nr:ribonuclease domain-containing protein [Lysobacter sp. cf310]SFL11489.1 Guanyl-specific ribonuclease Sa [Lysobacter sp. cf310]
MRRAPWLIAALVLLGLWLWWQRPTPLPAPSAPSAATRSAPAPAPAAAGNAATDFLPAEAHEVLARIARGGPYQHRQDGGTFQNRERRLPPQPRGYYREYTVETPGESDRGARRIVTGGDPPSEYYYTDDHYRSFRRFDPSGASP